jgi:hypothetical protein
MVRITVIALFVAMVWSMAGCEKDIHEAKAPGHDAIVASAR